MVQFSFVLMHILSTSWCDWMRSCVTVFVLWDAEKILLSWERRHDMTYSLLQVDKTQLVTAQEY